MSRLVIFVVLSFLVITPVFTYSNSNYETIYIIWHNDDASEEFGRYIQSELADYREDLGIKIFSYKSSVISCDTQSVIVDIKRAIQNGEIRVSDYGESRNYQNLKIPPPDKIIFLNVNRKKREDEFRQFCVGIFDYNKMDLLYFWYDEMMAEDYRSISKDIIEEMRFRIWKKGLYDSKPNDPSFEIKLQKRSYREGDLLRLTIKLDQDSYVYIFVRSGDLLDVCDIGDDHFDEGTYIFEATTYINGDQSEVDESIIVLVTKKPIEKKKIKKIDDLEDELRKLESDIWGIRELHYTIRK